MKARRAARPTRDPARRLFVDETRASTNMTRADGRRPVGGRPVLGVPHGHRQTTAFVAALRCDGLVAPTVVGGAMTGGLFAASVGRQLAPTLRPGDIVVTDDLSCRKGARVRRAIEGAGCELGLLPPYGPDLNPIEKAFGKLEAPSREAARRTREGWGRTWAKYSTRSARRSAATTSGVAATRPLHQPGNRSRGEAQGRRRGRRPRLPGAAQ